MVVPLLVTKLYIPPPRAKTVPRPDLVDRLNEGLLAGRRLTLISAAAGFGKTTLLSEWLAGCGRPAAWLSLDEGDQDPARFLAYLAAALQTCAPHLGAGVLAALQAPQPPPPELLLTSLLNETAALPEPVILVLDDYHSLDSQAVDQAVVFLLEHLPPQLHLVLATREDPPLPLARLRARGQLTELRTADLRFTPAEAADFLKQVMGLRLSPGDISTLEQRTEGWAAGLQLAALALQGTTASQGVSGPALPDAASFIQSFAGSHHFVLDYLLQEVLHQQPESVQRFLLHTAILDRLCGPLCDALLAGQEIEGQATLEYLERANLFIIPLDNQRRWYRYHHLFGELLRQRLQQARVVGIGLSDLHIRASQWYEDHGLVLEAFQHAAAAPDLERAARLVAGEGLPQHLRGAVTPVLRWLAGLPRAFLDAHPALWAQYGALLLVTGQTNGVDEKLQAAEAGLQGTEWDDRTRNLVGQIATAWATLALTRYQVDAMLTQTRRALEYLSQENLPFRTTAQWILGFASILQGDRVAARQACTEAIALSRASGNIFTTTLATIGLGLLQELENQLAAAAQTYRDCLALFSDPPLPHASEAHLGLARILYEWNDLDAAERHAQQALQLAHQFEGRIDRFILCEVLLARLKLARGDAAGAAALLAQAEQSARQQNFTLRLPEVAAAQVLVFLRLGRLDEAALRAQAHDLPLSRARVCLAQGNPAAALAVLRPYRQQAEARGWADETLKALVLEAAALQAQNVMDPAVAVLAEALVLAEPGGFLRLFVDEGPPMARLLAEAAARGFLPGYTQKLLAAFQAGVASTGPAQPLIDPLSARELEILRLIAQGLSNQAISAQLFIALDTVKGHNRRIFEKLQVERRTEAVARAQALGLL